MTAYDNITLRTATAMITLSVATGSIMTDYDNITWRSATELQDL